jgi:anaerobic selenocysteine-containing dehydrogenase
MISQERDNSKSEKHHRFDVINRRTFLKLSAAFAAVLAMSRFFKHPAAGALPYTPEAENREISEEWIATSCLNCSTRCATKVRVVDGKAVKITGNTLSQVSEGKTCPRAHIGLQVLYDPDRVKKPLKRTNPVKGKGVDPGWEAISWEQALGEVSGRLKSLRRNRQPHRLLILHGLNTISDDDIIARFTAAFGTPNVFSTDPSDNEAVKAGGWMADGHYSQCAYDLPNTNYIIAFGAGILESEKPLARNLRMWGKIRRDRPNRAKVVVIEPRYSVTASRADRWLPINPGTDGALAMAIANVIISEGLYNASFITNHSTGFEAYSELALKDYQPETVSGITGIPAETIRNIAREFARTQPAIAWRGRGATCWPNGTHNSYAIYCLNALVGSIDIPGGVTYQQNPDYRPLPEIEEDDIAATGRTHLKLDLSGIDAFPIAKSVINQVADSIIDREPYAVEMAIGFNGNPVIELPGAWRWREAFEQLPYYVHVAPFFNETAEYADILLPSNSYLETWGYDHSPPGSGFAELKIKQPIVQPLYDTRDIIDVVFALAGATGGSVARSFSGIGDNAEGFVAYRTGSIAPWEELRRDGVKIGPAYEFYKYDRIFNTPSKKFEFFSGNLEARLKELGFSPDNTHPLPQYEQFEYMGDPAKYPLLLSTYQPLPNIENGSQNYPWAQEVYLVMHGRGWTNLVEVNSRTAGEISVRDGDEVYVESPYGKIRGKARVFEGIMPGVVSIASGQGHYADGRWANGIGLNPNEITGVDYDRLSGQSVFYNTRIRVYRA